MDIYDIYVFVSCAFLRWLNHKGLTVFPMRPLCTTFGSPNKVQCEHSPNQMEMAQIINLPLTDRTGNLDRFYQTIGVNSPTYQN